MMQAKRRFTWCFAVVLAGGVSLLALPGCGGGNDAKSAHVTPADMPEGESWPGVYYHPVYGYLHMIENGTSIVGRWKRTDQSAWGELSGTKNGNVLHFAWKEHKYGMVGPAAESHGKGVFVYKAGSNGIAELDGTYGQDGAESGGDWHCVKQQRMNPDLNSITGDMGGVAPAAAGKWE